MGNPFKSFTPYRVTPEGCRWFEQALFNGFEGKMARDYKATKPEGQRWRSVGFTKIGKYADSADAEVREYCFTKYVQGDLPVYLMMVRFYERILPGTVIKEAMRPIVDRVKKDLNREPTRQELAEIRDQVESELLPKAFIRTTDVPVVLAPQPDYADGLLLVCGSSAKRVDDILLFLIWVFEDSELKGIFRRIQTQQNPTHLFRKVAVSPDGDSAANPDGTRWFELGDEVVCKGNGQKAVRIKGAELSGREFTDLLHLAEYTIQQIGLRFMDTDTLEDEEQCAFVMTSTFTFKNFVIHNEKLRAKYLNEDDAAEAIMRYVTILAEMVANVRDHLVFLLGGLAFDEPPAADDERIAVPVGGDADDDEI